MMTNRVAVIVPAYNEEHTVGDVVRRVRALGDGYDPIVINDGSDDRTSAMALEGGATVIELPHNLGIGAAVQIGFGYALRNGYDVCVKVDGDGQHPPEVVPHLVKVLVEERCDIVIGSRFSINTGYKITFMRRLGIRIISAFLKLATGMRIKDPTSGFRAIDMKAVRVFTNEFPSEFPEPVSLIIAHRNHLKVREVSVLMINRMHGSSSITPARAGYYMIEVLLSMLIRLFRK